MGSSAFRDEPGLPALAATNFGPLVGEMLELAIAVELIAEQVAEHDQSRFELRRDPGQLRLSSNGP